MIEAYDGGPLVAGEPLVARPGFWSNHLLGSCCRHAEASPEWFGDDGADADALSDVLMDPERWPVFRLPVTDGHAVVVVYRNLVGDHALDFLLTAPQLSGAHASVRRIASCGGDLEGSTLTWRELVRMADGGRAGHGVDDGRDGSGADGVTDPAVRLLLLLPLLREGAVPDEAADVLTAALVAVGAPPETAAGTAEHLLDDAASGPWHDPAWRSPLSGGTAASAPVPGGILARLGID
ncbi:hypothetical protein WN71_029420 [Streptomyces mangrovisoli]|uniref:Uncharacterized protein n=1 Tax=Streptomyces mangrovisoli TaxID=1428628 RepID=A0A1J4NQG0_9ACTN|nr:hypothetical protein WN71_029420 [Streptomyces mangrovisoli]